VAFAQKVLCHDQKRVDSKDSLASQHRDFVQKRIHPLPYPPLFLVLKRGVESDQIWGVVAWEMTLLGEKQYPGENPKLVILECAFL
jgi:hypothetical protein